MESMGYGNGQNANPNRLPHSRLKRSTNSRGTQTDLPPNEKAPRLVSLITKFEGLDAARVDFEFRDAQPVHLHISRDNSSKTDTASRAQDKGRVKRAAEQFTNMAERPYRVAKNFGDPKERTEGKAHCGRQERIDREGQRPHNKVLERARLLNDSTDSHTSHSAKMHHRDGVNDIVISTSSRRDGPIIIANGPSLYSTSPCTRDLLLTTPAVFYERPSSHGIPPSVERSSHSRIRTERQSLRSLVVRKEHERLDLPYQKLMDSNYRNMASQSKSTNNVAYGKVHPPIEKLRKCYGEETSKSISQFKMQEDNIAMKAFCSTVLKSVIPRPSEKPAFLTVAQGPSFPTGTKPFNLKTGLDEQVRSLKPGARSERPEVRQPVPNKDRSERLEALKSGEPSRITRATARTLDAPSSVWPIAAYIPYSGEMPRTPPSQLHLIQMRLERPIKEPEKQKESGLLEGNQRGQEDDRPLFAEISHADPDANCSNRVESTPPAYVPTPVFRPYSSPPSTHNALQETNEKGNELDKPLWDETLRADFSRHFSNLVEPTPLAYAPTPVLRPWSTPPPAHDALQEGKGKGKEVVKPLLTELPPPNIHEDCSYQVQSTTPAYVSTSGCQTRPSPPLTNGVTQGRKGQESIGKHASAAFSLQEKHDLWKRSVYMARNARQDLYAYQKRPQGTAVKERQKFQARQERFARRSRSRSRFAPGIASPNKKKEKTKETSFRRQTEDLELEDMNAMNGILPRTSANQEKVMPPCKAVAGVSQSEPAKTVQMAGMIVAQCELAQPKPKRSMEICQMEQLCRTGLKEGQRDESNKRQKTVK